MDFFEISNRVGALWAAIGPKPVNPTPTQRAPSPAKPISVGLTCWLWQRRAGTIVKIAQRMGVQVQLTQHIHGLRREIECQVSGENVDRFIGEFVRHC